MAGGLSFLGSLGFGVVGALLNSNTVAYYKAKKNSKHYKVLSAVMECPWTRAMYKKLDLEYEKLKRKGTNSLNKGIIHYIRESKNQGIEYSTTLWFIDELERRHIQYEINCVMLVTGYMLQRMERLEKEIEEELIIKIKQSNYLIEFDKNGNIIEPDKENIIQDFYQE